MKKPRTMMETSWLLQVFVNIRCNEPAANRIEKDGES